MALIERQREIGSQIERVVSNFKKDGSERKTTEYLAERLRRLSSLTEEFHKNHTEIIATQEVPDDDEYFMEEYYEKITQLAVRYIKIIEGQNLEQVLLDKGAAGIVPVSRAGAGAVPKQQSAKTKSNAASEVPKQLPGNSTLSSEIQKTLRNQRALMRALNRNIEEIAAQAHVEHPSSYYEIKSAILEKHMKEFTQNDHLLWESTTDDNIMEYTQQIFYEIESKVEAVLIDLRQYMNRDERSAGTPRVVYQQENDVPLPKISVPTFNGNYLQWMAFKDLYTELVHNANISNARKMHYLKQALTGEPKSLIQHLPATGGNYLSAWTILTSRYDNKRVLVTTLLNQLLMQPSTKAESSSSMKALHDVTQECMYGLSAQGIPVQHWDTIVAHIVLKKMDQGTQTAFEQGLDDNRRLIMLEEVLKFLERRFQSLEARGKGDSSSKTCATTVETDSKCKVCKRDNHPLYACGKFTSATSKEKWQWVSQLKLCANCLKTGHRASTCSRQHCLKCTKKHNTLLHPEKSDQATKKPAEQAAQEGFKRGTMRTQQTNTMAKQPDAATDNGTVKVSLVANNDNVNENYVLLGTALIQLVASNGQLIECRALLDSCSQVNLITEKLLKKLGRATRPSSTCVEGIGVTKNTIVHRTTIQLQSKHTNFAATLDAHVLPKIVSDQPSHRVLTEDWNIPKKITLADPTFAKPGRIDCLLGAEIYFDLLTHGNMKLSKNLPTLQNTVFGWIIAGSITSPHSDTVTCGVCTTQELEDTISKFWQLEDTPHSSTSLTEDELRCESHFVQHTKRTKDGKFVVKLPLKEHPSVLGSSKSMAYSRFLSLERRLNINLELKAQYTQFLTEYEKLGHMTEVNTPDDTVSTHYFIPHHCILRPESTSTKLRVVFDASARTSNGTSLNDIMYNGPTVQSELFSLLLRFRIHKFVLKTDVEKMYRQIWVDHDDRRLQMIMWRNSPAERLKYYQLNTVTYGTRAAPYLATRCLNQLADEYHNHFPLGATSLKKDFYVDDGLLGADSMREALETQQQLITILDKAGMKLRKWCANHPKLLHGIPSADLEINLNFDSEEQQSTKTLGLLWLPKSDLLCIRSNVQKRTSISKRSMTSDLARIFDPLGLIGPVVVTAKIYIQQLWQLKIDWDAELPQDIRQQWTRFQDDLPSLDNATIARHVLSGQGQLNIQLHAFSDASEKAYGAAIYIRSVQKDKSIKLNLLCSKSRVAPLKQQTIPRLELCAALLAAELMSKVKTDLNYQDKATYLWTDSQIVLSWINHHPGTLPVFVAHRIVKINQLTTPEQWRHVPSKGNPADLLSRGLKPRELPTCHMWFFGPLFLYQPEPMWPSPFNRELIIDNEVATVALSSKKVNNESEQQLVYSIPSKNSFSYVQRVLGYVLRFAKNVKKAKISRPDTKQLSPSELDAALKVMVRQIQATDFQDLRKILVKEGRVQNSNSLNSLTPFLDEEGIIRVGGRLSSSSQQYDAKHQMILPGDDPLTKLLLEKIHKENYHCGPSALLAFTKQRFWPLKGRSLVRSIVQHCVRCTRSRPLLYKQIMGNLPPLRVEPARPFLHTGVDYCGPFKVHFKTRGKPPQKAYIAVFCCFSTKAVHLELVTELTTDAFLGALKRFISRRGHCKTIFCDNATNFVGAKNQLEELKDQIYSPKASASIIRTCSEKGINFQFIPPRAPHFGGLWEAAVKSTKKLLAPKMYESSMTFEELNTVVTEVEAMLNSRPLVPMSSDPNDLDALTPGHFLIGEPLRSNVDTNSKSLNTKLTARWEEVSKLKHKFWERWSTEYLAELQQRQKWRGPTTIIKPDTMVIIKEDNCPVLQWPLGRIIKVYKGDDGRVRVCDIRTQKGVIQRPVHRLAPLVPEDNNEAHQGKETESAMKETGGTRISLPISIPLSRLKNTSSWANDSIPAKVRRIQPNLLLTLVALFFLPLILCNPVNITTFSQKPGIYFEPLGAAKLVTTNWNMVVYYDLQPYRDQIDLLIDGTNTLQKLCDHTNDTACNFLIHYFDNMKTELETELNLLSVKRTKRGAVDLIGNVANSLFGVLDSNYAAKMSETINGLQQNDEHLERLLKNQTSLINSTINIFKDRELSIKAKFEEMDKKIDDLRHGRASTASNNKSLILSLSIQMLIIAAKVQGTHASIMDVLIDSHHGKINPLLLTPEQLGNEVQKIRAHLPPTLQLPIHQNNLLEIYKIMKVNGIVAENHVVFSIELPLSNSKEFKLLHIVPIATEINGTLSAVKSTTQFLAISPHHNEFIPLSREQVDLCSNWNDKEWLCPNMQATYHKTSTVSQCELDLLNNESEPRCELHRLDGTILWNQLQQPNQWIYATTISVRFTAVCGGEIHQFTLEHSGLLQFRSDCTINNDLITIEGHQKFVTSLHAKNTNFGVLMGWANQYAVNSSKLSVFKTNFEDLESIQRQLEQINASSLPRGTSIMNNHSVVVSYVAVILTLLMIVYMVIFIRKLKQQRAPPIPAPRRSQHHDETPC